MEPLLLRVSTAPLRLTAGTWLAATAGGINSDAGTQEAEFSQSVEIEPTAISVEADDPNTVEVPVYGGDPRFYPNGLPRRRLGVDVSAVDVASLRVLYRMLRSGRAVSVGAWHDDSTLWMSRFGGQALDGDAFVGVAEVGDCAAGQVARRSVLDYVPSPMAGANLVRSVAADAYSNPRPKIVPGMIGSAISLCGARRNLAAPRFPTTGTPVFTKVGSTLGGVNAYLRHNFLKAVPGEAYTIPYSSPFNDGVEVPSTTISASTRYTISVYARGQGAVTLAAMNGFSVIGQQTHNLADDWQRLAVEFTSQGGQTAVRFRVSSAGAGATVQLAGLQIEAGYGTTDFLDSGAALTTADAVLIRETLPASAWSMVWWVKHRTDNNTNVLFSTNLGASGDVFAYVQSDVLTLTVGSLVVSRTLPAGLAGQWVQLAVVFGGAMSSGSTARAALYCNGQLLGSVANGAGLNFYPAASTQHTTYLGSDAGLGSPSGAGLNMELDRFRLDARAWTAADVAADYRRLTDPGIAGLLEVLEGRYFRASASFNPRGPFLDSLFQRLTLTEVGVARAGVY